MDTRETLHCVICGRRLRPDRTHFDTCGAGCYARLLVQQRREIGMAAEVLETVRAGATSTVVYVAVVRAAVP